MNKKLLLACACLFCSSLADARTERLTIQGDHGKLVADLQMPDVMPKRCPIVILCHGFGGARNNGLFNGIADELEKLGIATIRFDFNGHGESEGDFQQMTVPNEVEDARHIYEYVKADARFGRIGIAGHSQGGVVTAMLAGQLGKKALKGGVVLLAPAGVLRDDAIRGTVAGQPPFQGDPLDPPEYVEVWGHRLGREYIKTAFWLPIYETAEGYKGKACIVHGTSDRVVPYTYGLRFHQIWKGSEWHLLDRYDHGFGPNPSEAVKCTVDFFSKQF
ncbi:MAG: alpha/beta fold hydrolase [Bacteroidaceae bacterium]|nr:alpha/beta fold hydrolase [Bacteroidales bacterium]MBP5769914.1 alpha/beta fold hydrolase [Bacteroidaceae bacterium]